MKSLFQSLARLRAWAVFPVGRLTRPLRDNVGVFDFLLRDPIALAIEREFYRGAPGESLLVAPGQSPLAGILLLGYGQNNQAWDQAAAVAFATLATALPRTAETVAVFPPYPVKQPPPVAWPQAAERFVPQVAHTSPWVRRWLWIDPVREGT